MGSSSKKKGNGTLGLGASGPPQMGTVSDSLGVKQSYYKDPAQVPKTGGWVLPTAPPGAPQGIARNFAQPQPQPRDDLAMLMGQIMGSAGTDRRFNGGGGRNRGGYTTSTDSRSGGWGRSPGGGRSSATR